ncbi:MULTISPECIES: glutamate--cysteine ligase [Microbacterium]|uniref:glutamate--cysteine ligase n=1 Tax=Microbacterium TaxID=33882 RepID=UPI001B7D2578|nr:MULTISPECIES: glutamate--cysteine ligase [Microbacterium]
MTTDASRPQAGPRRTARDGEPARTRPVRSVGLEEEFLLVDAETFLPAALSDAIVGPEGVHLASGTILEHEVKQEQIEVVSPPLFTFDQLLAAIVSGRRAADRAARAVGARVAALATSPVKCDTHAVATSRYAHMTERFGLTMSEQLTCGLHVHVRVHSADEGVAVLDRIRPWLPVILALSANSPFWRGDDSEFASYRYQAWGRWPGSGAYDRFGSSEAYFEAVERMLRTEVSLDTGMVYFDARLSAHVPTVEVRIADVCLAAEDSVTVALIVRALVETAVAEWRAGLAADDVPTSLLRLASWRASRSGLDGDLLDPRTGTPRPAGEVVDALLRHVEGGFTDRSEATRIAAHVYEIVRRGSGAAHQRVSFARHGDGASVIRDAVAATLARPHGRR